MVAETAELPAKIKRKPGERGPEIPVMIRLKARTLYLNEMLPAKVIAERTGLTPETIDRLAHREGWTALRREQKSRIIQKQNTQADSLLTEAIEAIRSESIELCKPALDSVRKGFDTGGLNGAKQAQAASAALKNLAMSYRSLAESDGSTGESQVLNMNLFFCGMPAAQTEPVKQAEQVTEVEGKSV